MQLGIGDSVSFKSDIEQSGTIIRIKKDIMGRKVFVLQSECGVEGEYIGGEDVIQVLASECWVD